MKSMVLSAALVAAGFGVAGTSHAAAISCEYSNNGFFCEAFPQAPGYTYSWDVNPPLYFPDQGNPEFPFRNIGCISGRGYVYVTINKAGAGTESTHRLLRCNEGPPYNPR